MSRFVIEKVDGLGTLPPDVPGLRVTINLPNLPPRCRTWADMLNWFAHSPDIPYAIHLAVRALVAVFFTPPNPP